jgi:prevent-host-death family protein
MADSVAWKEAQEHLPELLDRVARGEEIVIERDGQAVSKLVPVAEAERKGLSRIGGQNLLGVTYSAPDFDAPMTEEELKEWGY